MPPSVARRERNVKNPNKGQQGQHDEVQQNKMGADGAKPGLVALISRKTVFNGFKDIRRVDHAETGRLDTHIRVKAPGPTSQPCIQISNPVAGEDNKRTSPMSSRQPPSTSAEFRLEGLASSGSVLPNTPMTTTPRTPNSAGLRTSQEVDRQEDDVHHEAHQEPSLEGADLNGRVPLAHGGLGDHAAASVACVRFM